MKLSNLINNYNTMALQLTNWNYLKIWWDNRIIQNNYTLTAYIYNNKEERDLELQPKYIKQYFFEITENIPADEVERIAFGYKLLSWLEEYKDWINV